MNELRRNGKRTREQLTFSDTYLVLDNLREYDFDLVSFYVTFNQYIDRRNYEGKAKNSLIFANNEALFRAFNVSRNRFYRLLKLAYECGLIDIEKGSNNRNIYILNDIVPFEPLNKIRNWENRNGQGKSNGTTQLREENKEENIKQEKSIGGKKVDEEEIVKELGLKKKETSSKKYRKKGYPKKEQVKPSGNKKTPVPKQDEDLSLKGIGSCPEKGQPPNSSCLGVSNVLDGMETTSNSSKVLIDLSFNRSKSISQSISIYDNNNINDSNVNKKTDGQDRFKEQMDDLYKLLKRCEIYLVDESYKDAVVHAIRLLLLDIENKKIIKIGENLIPTQMVRNDLKELDLTTIKYAIDKFKAATATRKIRNVIAYLKSCIYNAIHEMKIEKLCIDPRDKYALLFGENAGESKEKLTIDAHPGNKFKTKFHLAKSRGDKYTADELEQLILDNQKKKIKEKLIFSNKTEYQHV